MFEREKLTETRETEAAQQVFKDEPPQQSERESIDQLQVKAIVKEVKLQASKEKDRSRQRKLGTATASSRMTEMSKRSRRSVNHDLKLILKKEKQVEALSAVSQSPPAPKKSRKKKESPKKPMNEEAKMQLMQKRLRFLHSHFGAVLKGYKIRRIFHNNSVIRKMRLEFREII